MDGTLSLQSNLQKSFHQTSRLDAVDVPPTATHARQVAPNIDRHAMFLEEGYCEQEDLLTLLDEERQRIALDLHDGLGQILTLINLQLREATSILSNKFDAPNEVVAPLMQAEALVLDAIAELRRTAMDLYPTVLSDLGIIAALRWFLRELENTKTGMIIDLVLDVHERQVPPHLRIIIFRILQEGVNNVIKHAHARKMRIGFGNNAGRLTLTIEDDGVGCAAAGNAPSCGGLGLKGIVKRAHRSGGTCNIRSDVGCGTSVIVSWPM